MPADRRSRFEWRRANPLGSIGLLRAPRRPDRGWLAAVLVGAALAIAVPTVRTGSG